MQLTISNLSAGYNDTAVVRDVSFAVDPGQIAVIVGPNGCGKTTLLKTIARLVRPARGQVLLDEMDVWRSSPAQVARLMSLLPQQPVAPEGISVQELVRFGRHPHQGLLRQWSKEDYDVLEQALAAADLQSLRHIPLEHLSGGQKQRAWLAMCLAQDTPVVLLDEPTSALDLGHQMEVLTLVKSLARQGKAFLLVLHDLFSACRFADKLIAMKEGKIISQGDPVRIVSTDLIQNLYDIECDILRAPDDDTPVVTPRLRT